MIFGFQIKAGRGIVRMSQIELGELSTVSVPTIQRIENDEEHAKSATQDTMNKLRRALEDSGVKFIKATDAAGNGAGVRLWMENKKNN